MVSKSQKTLMMKNLRSLKEVVAGVQVVMKKFIIKLLLKNWAIYFQQSINYLLIQLKTLLVVLQQSIILAMKMMGFFFKMFWQVLDPRKILSYKTSKIKIFCLRVKFLVLKIGSKRSNRRRKQRVKIIN